MITQFTGKCNGKFNGKNKKSELLKDEGVDRDRNKTLLFAALSLSRRKKKIRPSNKGGRMALFYLLRNSKGIPHTSACSFALI